MTNRLAYALASSLALFAATPASAADPWPTRPIRVIVPYAAGGVVDVQTRVVTERLAKELGQPIVVEAKPGANANIGAETVARAAPDGYTLLVTAPYFINNPMSETGLRWAPKDFVPVGRFALSPSFYVVPVSSPARTLKEFVEYAKKANPRLQYGEGGTGATQTVSNEIFVKVAGLNMEGVSYKGAPPIVPDLINGLVSMAVLPVTVGVPQVKAGKLRALANASSRRSPQLPDVPTLAEAGFPEATVLSWYGFHAPVGTPPEVIKRLEAALVAACATAEVKERMANTGGEEACMNTADFVGFMKSDTEQWEKIARSLKK